MKIGLLADIHGNLPALEICLQRLCELKLDRLFMLGDAVGYFPDGAAVLERLRSTSLECQKGNHEDMLLRGSGDPPEREDVYRLRATLRTLDIETTQWIARWPEARSCEVGGRQLLCVHGSPAAPLYGYVYPDSDLSPYAELDYDAVFMANTHRPFVTRLGSRLFVNVGSVGLPRDQGDLACCAVYDSERGECRILRLRFDARAVLARYGAFVHASVRECLGRQAQDPVGEVLA